MQIHSMHQHDYTICHTNISRPVFDMWKELFAPLKYIKDLGIKHQNLLWNPAMTVTE